MSASEDSPTGAADGDVRRRGASRDSAFLAAGSAANGLLAYVFFALASRTLGAGEAAPVSVLWSYWAVSGAVLTFPVQHWVIRRFTGDRHEATVRRALPRLCAVAALLALVSGGAALLFGERLFGVPGAAYPLMVAGITVGSFVMGLVRGVLSGRGHYGATALSLVAENLLRVVAAGAVAWAGGSAYAFGLALVAGPLVAVAWARHLRLRPPPPDVRVGRGSLALLSGVAGGSLVGQVVLSGSPVVLALVGGAPAAVTSLFLALAVWRAPYLVAMGMTPQLTAALTRLALQGPPRRVVRASRLTALGVLGGSALAVLAGTTVLRPVLQLAFGAQIRLADAGLAGLGVGTVFALGNLVLLLTLLALGRSHATTVAWVVGVCAAAGWLLLGAVPPAPRVVVAFLVAEAGTFVLLALTIERYAGGRAQARYVAPGRAG